MKLWRPCLFALVTLLAACATQPAADGRERVVELAQRVIDDVAANADFNGAVVPMRDGQVLFEQAVGLAQRNPDRVAKDDRSRIAGACESATMGRLQIDVAADGRSFLRVNSGERVSLFALPEGVFYAPILDLWLGFTGTAAAPTLHLRSVFHRAEARRVRVLAAAPR